MADFSNSHVDSVYARDLTNDREGNLVHILLSIMVIFTYNSIIAFVYIDRIPLFSLVRSGF